MYCESYGLSSSTVTFIYSHTYGIQKHFERSNKGKIKNIRGLCYYIEYQKRKIEIIGDDKWNRNPYNSDTIYIIDNFLNTSLETCAIT